MSDRASEWRQATLFDDELEVVRPDNIKAGISVQLSPREWEIVKRLSR